MSERKLPPVAAVLAAIVAVQALLVLWFAWPAQKAEPRDLPVVVAGPQQAADEIAARLGQVREGAFEVTTVADAAAADAALADREAYGAFVVTPSGVEVLCYNHLGIAFPCKQLIYPCHHWTRIIPDR